MRQSIYYVLPCCDGRANIVTNMAPKKAAAKVKGGGKGVGKQHAKAKPKSAPTVPNTVTTDAIKMQSAAISVDRCAV